MAPRPWSEGTSRHQWLDSHSPAYHESIHTKTKISFLEKVYHDWFEKYHWSLDVRTELDPIMVYVEPTLEAEILKKNKAIVTSKEAIACWFTNEESGIVSFSVHPGSKLSNKLKPRLPQLEHIYSAMYFVARVKPHVLGQWEHDKNKMGPKNKLWSQVSSSQALTWEMWDAKTPDIHEKVEVEHQCRYEISLANFEQENPEGVMAVVTENTGFMISVLVGGPSPVANGNLATFHIHKGVTKEEHPLDFGSFAHELVNDSLIPKFIEFLSKAFHSFTVDDVCASHSLATERPEIPTLEPFVDPTRGMTHILTGDSHDRKPSPEPPPGLSRHLKLNSDTTELTLVECVRTRIRDSTLISPILDRAYEALSNKTCNPLLNRVDTSTGVVTPPKTIETKGIASPNWTRPSLRSGQSPDSTASSLMGTVWKPGHHTQRDYSDTQTSEAGGSVMPVSNERARSTTNESLTNENSVDQELLHRRTLLASVADSIRREQGPSAAADVRLINTSLYHLAYNLDVESPSFTSTVIRVSCTGHPTVFKPDTEFCLTLLQCGQILQDTAVEMAKHYFLSDPDPYKFDPGGMLAVHVSAGVSSEDKVLQLAALALCRLHTGLKIIAQLQSVDENESVAYTTNSKAQGYVTGIVNDPPQVTSPLAAYSVPERGLLWRNQEIPTPGTLASDEGTQLPHPQFDIRRPRPSVDPLRQQVLANSTRTTGIRGSESWDYRSEPPPRPVDTPLAPRAPSDHGRPEGTHWNPPDGGPPDGDDSGNGDGPPGRRFPHQG
ncbi:hypothetical protein BS47DRAFT_1369300 [Hydnum rufescens UP504]|uniref:Uncharacterized protein n=1 Tax=Hydnum rufescens UP504 TaxID=1448309 RepID=A0A9P6DFS8_9AGAM|nr:hypothetical protein BS47DRAFT_1369300 [Hydnum rufescens UP504]